MALYGYGRHPPWSKYLCSCKYRKTEERMKLLTDSRQ